MALRDGLAASLKGGDGAAGGGKDGAARNEKDAHAIFTPNEEIDFWAYQKAALKGDAQQRAAWLISWNESVRVILRIVNLVPTNLPI